MDFKTGREIALIGIRLLDDAYLAWVAAESEAEAALRNWCEGQHAAGYQAYRAAADREEAAARDLERLHELTAVCVEALLVPEEPGEAGLDAETRLSVQSRS